MRNVDPQVVYFIGLFVAATVVGATAGTAAVHEDGAKYRACVARHEPKDCR